MARRGALTALQAVLAGISGGAGGYIQQEEMKRKRLTEEQERERRKALDIADLQARNYTSPEQLAKSREAAAPATSRVARSAILSALSPMAPAPMPSTADIGTVMETAALRQPLASEQRLSMYGQEFVRPESPIATTTRERSMERAQKMFDTAQERRDREKELEAKYGKAQADRDALAQTVGQFTQLTPQLRDAVVSGAMSLPQALDQVKPKDEKTIGGIPEASVRVANSLRDDWRTEPSVKRAETIADQTRIVQAAAKNPDAAGDLSLIFAYMRVLDPTSVVREREFANAQNAAGVPDRIRNIYNNLLKGQRLNEAQREQFVSRSLEIAKQSDISLQRQVNRYTKIANKYGIDPEMVIDNPFEGLFDAEAPAPAAGGGSARDRLRARATGGRP